jgi:4'-phosphopantetheinyl transferase EntD
MPDLAGLAIACRALLPLGVAVAQTDPRAEHQADPDSPPGAVLKRVYEFAAGRAAARLAMEELGQPHSRLPIGPDRAPIWPLGLTGSITHSDMACLVAVAPIGLVGAIGLDLAEDLALDRALWPIVCRPEELAWLSEQPQSDQGPLAMAIFSAKEATYKAQYPLTGRLFGFDGLTIRFSGDRFSASRSEALSDLALPAVLNGRHLVTGGHHLSVMALASEGTSLT